MERDVIRLEVLKLSAAPRGRQLAETLAEAEAFFEFVTKKEEPKAPVPPSGKNKKTDKPDILS